MRFLILGPLEVRGEYGAVALGGSKLRGLLATLLLHPNEPVSAGRLALALWGEDAPREAAKTVQVHVSRLRRALGDTGAIETTPAGYRLRVGRDELDAARFERLAEEGRRALQDGRPEQAAVLLRDALGLWRGSALAELACEAFAGTEIARLDEQRLAALEARVDADLACSRHAELVGELRQLVAVHPTRERFAAQLMLALYRCDRQTEALQAFHDTRRVLVDVGVEPGPGLRELQQAILCQDAALDRVGCVPAAGSEPDGATAAAAGDRAGGSDAAAGLVPPALPRSLDAAASSPFVGRDAELARLHERWAAVEGGARSVVLIGGEPGIGKTRLAGELARPLHEEGALVLYGRCDDGLAVPYQPFVEALRPYAHAVGADRIRDELGDLGAELGRLLPELGALGKPAPGDPESKRYALFEAVAALIEMMTRERRALLVLDDLHWAARPTLLLLRHLVRCERSLHLLIVGGYRQTDVDMAHPLGQLLADLQRDASAERLSISGLGEPAIATLLEASLGHPLDGSTAELAHVLGAQTAGNPFFIGELLAHLMESGTIAGDDGPTAAQLEVPEGLRQVIGQRVARLSAPAGRALQIAAVAGTTFPFVLLERVLGEREGVLDALDEAVAAGLLTEAGNADFGFAHALVRQTLYRELGSARRMCLHRRLGEALEALGDTDAHVEALAYHFAHAAADGQADKAADYALAAGRSTIARLGYEEAAVHYERGLRALTLNPQPPEQRHGRLLVARERRRCELLLGLGAAYWGTGELDKARRAFKQAAARATPVRAAARARQRMLDADARGTTGTADAPPAEFGDPETLARAALGFCGPHRFEVAAAVTRPVADLLERALAALGQGDSALRAQLLGRLAAALAHTGAAARTPVLAREALEMARRVADRATLADVLASTHWTLRDPDLAHESSARADELEVLADELGDARLRALAHMWRLDLLLTLADIEAVERELDALRQLARTRPDRYLTWLVRVLSASHAILQGRYEEGETLAHDALAHRFLGHDEPADRVFAAQMTFVRAGQGRVGELVDAVRSSTERYPQVVGWRCLLALLHAHRGETAQARGELEALARAGFADVPRDESWLVNLSMLSGIVFLLGDGPRARLLYELLAPYADRCVVSTALVSLGSAARPLGMLAATIGEYEDAQRHFEHALTVNAQIRSPIWIAHTQKDYARMLLLRDRTGDRARAQHLLGHARATAERLGLKAPASHGHTLAPASEAA